MHEVWMREALKLAREAQMAGEVPVGAVVVCKEKIIACARNERETSGDPTAHAEVLALRRAAEALGTRRLEGCTLYVTLEPCPMCAGAIVMAGIDAVFFGAYDPRCGCAGSLYDLPEDASFGRVIPCSGGLLEAECRLALNAFFDLRRG
ncbi:MAG: nucleoside deaminase [Christensenellales bacterium]|nr:nucleoside deaminase [Christensenellales bacterium]